MMISASAVSGWSAGSLAMVSWGSALPDEYAGVELILSASFFTVGLDEWTGVVGLSRVMAASEFGKGDCGSSRVGEFVKPCFSSKVELVPFRRSSFSGGGASYAGEFIVFGGAAGVSSEYGGPPIFSPSMSLVSSALEFSTLTFGFPTGTVWFSRICRKTFA